MTRSREGRLIIAAAVVGWLIAAHAATAKSPPAKAGKVDLPAEAKALVAEWTERLGEGYTARIDSRRHIVYVLAVDAKAFSHVMRLLGDVHDAQSKLLFPKGLRRNVTVVLPTVRDYRRLVPQARAHGTYNRRTRVLVSISFSGVLVHEFIHALHYNDQAAAGQDHPIWITEGLAMLFQSARVEGGRLAVPDGGGLEELQAALKAGKVRSLKTLCTLKPGAFMQDAELYYRQVHHVMLYLHRQGKLQAFYEAYRSRYAGDPTGAEALAKTLGKPLDRVDAEWRAWVRSRKPPWRGARKRPAHLGIRMAKAEWGVEVTALLRSAVAHRVQLLKKGDIIISLAGGPVRSSRDLAAAVQACQPGQIVDIEIIRAGHLLILKHRLGLAPK